MSHRIPQLITASSQDLAGGLTPKRLQSPSSAARPTASTRGRGSPASAFGKARSQGAGKKKKHTTRVYFGPLRMPYPGCKQEVELYLGLDVGVKKSQGPRGDAATPVERTFSGSSGPVSTFVTPSPAPAPVHVFCHDHGRILLREVHQTRAQGNQGQEVRTRVCVGDSRPLSRRRSAFPSLGRVSWGVSAHLGDQEPQGRISLDEPPPPDLCLVGLC